MLRPFIYNVEEIFPKSWGYEILITNGRFCGKVLVFENKGNKFSMHYHLKKDEVWYVQQGSFKMIWINTETANELEIILKPGNVIEIPIGLPHQLIALEDDSRIFEVSDEDFEDDSYRVKPGDSQS